jgi:hypothetical protein
VNLEDLENLLLRVIVEIGRNTASLAGSEVEVICILRQFVGKLIV